MASSSSSSHSAPASSSQSCKYDVYLSFRGEDTSKTFFDHLYSTLKQHQISVCKDDGTIPRGESINQSLFGAIGESRMAVIIFSINYADSSWCLDELTYIMKCKDERELIVIPIFYDVEPMEVRNQKGKFGEAFAKQVVKNVHKAELWRKVLVDVCKFAGWVFKNDAYRQESEFINNIVNTLLERLFSLKSYVEEDLVGMGKRIQDLKSLLDVGSGGVRMVGIWGVGGGGKTALANSVYIDISKHFQGYCFIENIREEARKYGLKKLQEKILSVLLKQDVKVESVMKGKYMMKRMFCHKSMLVVLDDVDELEQLKVLAGKHDWYGSGSRIIITTRDERLLKTHKVDYVYPVRLLSHDEAIRLFNRYAFKQENVVDDYESLSLRVVSYCAGLPLAIIVLGSFLYAKNQREWMSVLDKLRNIPYMDIMEALKISYDGLATLEKELFLDIVCFFRGKHIDDAMEILDACGFYPYIGIQVLRQKSLISIEDGRLDMHDLVQEMGHYIVRGNHPNKPEKHSRLWKHEEIIRMPFHKEAMVKAEAIRYDGYSYDHVHSSHFSEIVSKMDKLRWLSKSVCCDSDAKARGPNSLSNNLRYMHWESYPASPFPQSFQLTKLVVLKLWGSMQKEVWTGYKHLPCLKVLQLKYMWELLNTPNLEGVYHLQKLTLSSCQELEEIHQSLGNHKKLEYLSVSECPKLRMFPDIFRMKSLKTLEIKDCFLKDGEIPSGIGELPDLEELSLCGNDFTRLDFCLSQLARLKVLNLSNCVKLLELPQLPSNSSILKADYCNSLTTVGDCHINCRQLCNVSLMGGGIINDGGKLLQSMLAGNAMLLRLKGLDVAKGFTPPLLRGRRYRLQLPENWGNDFCGFLVCAIFPNYFHWSDQRIIIRHVTTGIDFEDDVVWEESDGDGDNHTFVQYLSFASMRDTKWWDQTYKALEFNIEDFRCCGFGVRLASNALTQTSTYSSDYIYHLVTEDNFEALTISLKF